VTKAKISEYSATAGDNTDVNGVNIAEGCPPSSMNNMGREIMAALKRFQVGSDGDGVTVGGNFVVSGSTSVNTFNVDVISEKTAAAGVTIDGVLLKDTVVTANTVKASGTASSQGKVEFFEDTDNGTNFVALQAPAAIAADVTFTLPAADGTSGQAIQTDGSGTLSFATISASPGGSTTQVQFNNAGAFGGISGVTTDGTRMTASTTIGVGGATPSTSGSGISFPATASASTNANTLDDYEEGTWTPVVVGTSTAGTASYVSQANAIYTKIGRAVTIQVWLEWSSGTGTGDLRMSGLPFTVNANYQAVPCVARMGPKITLTANNVLVTVFQQNTTQIVFNQYETGGSENATVAYDAAAGVFIAGTYTVA
jgi:hypothetical protein